MLEHKQPPTPSTLTKQDSRSRDADRAREIEREQEMPAENLQIFNVPHLSFLSLEQSNLSASLPPAASATQAASTSMSSTRLFQPGTTLHSAAEQVLSVVPEEKRRVLEARMTCSKDSNAVLVETVVGFSGDGSRSKDGITVSAEPYRYIPGGPGKRRSIINLKTKCLFFSQRADHFAKPFSLARSVPRKNGYNILRRWW